MTSTALLTNSYLIVPYTFASYAQGRICITSGQPFAFTNGGLTNTSIYYTPFGGNIIGLWNATTNSWDPFTFSEITWALSATTNQMYDLFAYNNAGVVALEQVAWTNDTTRATALTTQNGIYVKSGDPTRKYLGSFRTNGTTGTTSMDNTGVLIWNYYNRRITSAIINYVSNGGNNYTITSNVGIRRAGGVTTFNSIPYITGIGGESDQVFISINAFTLGTASVTGAYAMGYGNNTTATLSTGGSTCTVVPATGAISLNTSLQLQIGTTQIGYKVGYLLEYCTRSAGTFTINYNDGSGTTIAGLRIGVPC